MIRYIDDFVMCFQYREDALRVQDALLFRPHRTLYVGLITVALEHQVRDAPDVDLGDHAGRLSGERLCTVNAAVWGICFARDDFRLLRAPLAVSAVRSPVVVHSSLAVEAKAGEPAPV
jgi:hypothetical protein